MKEKPKSFWKLLWDMILMSFKWYRDKKKLEEERLKISQQQKIDELNKINENLQNQYNKIDEQKTDDNMTVEELKNKLNEKFK